MWYHPGMTDEQTDASLPGQTAVASIDELRMLGTTKEFYEMTTANRTELGKKKYDRLVRMMTRPEARPENSATSFAAARLRGTRTDFDRSQYGGGGL